MVGEAAGGRAKWDLPPDPDAAVRKLRYDEVVASIVELRDESARSAAFELLRRLVERGVDEDSPAIQAAVVLAMATAPPLGSESLDRLRDSAFRSNRALALAFDHSLDRLLDLAHENARDLTYPGSGLELANDHSFDLDLEFAREYGRGGEPELEPDHARTSARGFLVSIVWAIRVQASAGPVLPETMPMPELTGVLESFTGAVDAFVAQAPKWLIHPDDEGFINAQIKVIEALRSIDGPVSSKQILAAVGEIVRRLDERGVKPDQSLSGELQKLGLESPELEQVIDELSAMTAPIAEQWPDIEDVPDRREAAKPLVEADEARQSLWSRFVESAVESSGKTAGAAATTAVLTGAASVGSSILTGSPTTVWLRLGDLVKALASFL